MWKRLPLIPCVSWQHRELSFHLPAPLKFIARWVIYWEESRLIQLNPNDMKPVAGLGRKRGCAAPLNNVLPMEAQGFPVCKKMQHMCITWMHPSKTLWSSSTETHVEYKGLLLEAENGWAFSNQTRLTGWWYTSAPFLIFKSLKSLNWCGPAVRHESGQQQCSTKNWRGGGKWTYDSGRTSREPLHNPKAVTNCMLLGLSVFENAHIF